MAEGPGSVRWNLDLRPAAWSDPNECLRLINSTRVQIRGVVGENGTKTVRHTCQLPRHYKPQYLELYFSDDTDLIVDGELDGLRFAAIDARVQKVKAETYFAFRNQHQNVSQSIRSSVVHRPLHISSIKLI